MNPVSDFNHRYFTTYDLGLVSALITLGYFLDHMDKSDPRKVQFVISRTDGLDDAIQAYWSKQLSIDAQSHFLVIKMLKNRIYSE